jgi:hypothetical protein
LPSESDFPILDTGRAWLARIAVFTDYVGYFGAGCTDGTVFDDQDDADNYLAIPDWHRDTELDARSGTNEPDMSANYSGAW